VKPIFRPWFRKFKSRIQRRLYKKNHTDSSRPAFSARNIDYEVSDRDHAIAHGGIGAIHLLAQKLGLPTAIDDRLHVLKIHLPYHESDHVLNIAYNAMCNGTCLEDIELRRNDEAFLDALGAQRIPDPTTAGDFCRRFAAHDIFNLFNAIDDARLKVWAQQPPSFRKRASVDMDGSLVETAGECKAGMDVAYDGTWGYHPLILTLAETGEVLRLVNRSGNRPSEDGAAEQVDQAIWLCTQGQFERIVLRGDTAFAQTRHLDRWDAQRHVRFVFGYDSTKRLRRKAEDLPESAWQPLRRPERYTVKTQRRQRPDQIKDAIVRRRNFDVLRLQSEEVAEFDYRPMACAKTYRMVVVRKHISKEKGEQVLWPETRYFFYITNDRTMTPEQVVREANSRCNQENLHAQLKSGVRALRAPLNTLKANWAYMVIVAIAWSLKAWFALLIPVAPRWREQHEADRERVLRMEFRSFVQRFILVPAQIGLSTRFSGWQIRAKRVVGVPVTA